MVTLFSGFRQNLCTSIIFHSVPVKLVVTTFFPGKQFLFLFCLVVHFDQNQFDFTMTCCGSLGKIEQFTNKLVREALAKVAKLGSQSQKRREKKRLFPFICPKFVFVSLRTHFQFFLASFAFLFLSLSFLFIFYPLSPFYPLEKFWPQPFKKPGDGTLVN